MDAQEQELIRKAQEGVRFAFGELYDRHVADVYRFVAYRVRDRATAEDLVSVTFTKALDKLHQFDAKKSDASFRNWIFTIAYRAIIDHTRKKGADIAIDAVAEPEADDRTGTNAEQALLRSHLQAAMRHLTETQRTILTMRVWDDLPFATIAAVTETSEAACKMQVQRALKTLRAHLPPSLLTLLFFYALFP